MTSKNNKELIVDNIALPILEDLLTETSNYADWKDSKYEKYRFLSIDKRGSFGERFFSKTLSYRRINYQDGDQGDWDIKLDGNKFEVKTSSLDVNKKFQNENIKREADYYGILFLGIMPNNLCIKFVKKSEIPFKDLHNRAKRGTGAGYKWDFKIEDMTLIKTRKDVQDEFNHVFQY